MPLFSELFEKTNGQSLVYNKKIVRRALIFKGPKKMKIFIHFISRNSKYKQGVSFNMFTMKGKLSCNGEIIKKGSFVFWEHSSPKDIEVDVEIKDGELNIFNVSETKDHRGVTHMVSLNMGMAFYYEEINSNKYRCFCNDWEPDDDFDDLIFDIEFIEL